MKPALVAPLALSVAASVAALTAPARAASPTGNLDAAQPAIIGGWARDPDYPGPIAVHFYIDGQIAHAMLADAVRSDLPFADQAHGFSWTPPFLGPGTHTIMVYPIGVDANGVPDGDNPPLQNTPGTIADGCNNTASSVQLWCQGVPNYYVRRATDSRYLFSDNVRVGVNTSYGGSIFELYGRDHSNNLILEHGGGALQLSVWGYDPVGPGAFFGQGPGVCDPVPYDTEAECLTHNASCRAWGASRGAHVANCTTVVTCVDWGAGAPFNPIQAQGDSCGWDAPGNDVDSVDVDPTIPSVHTVHGDPFHFTKSNNFPGMTFEQTTRLLPAGVVLDYRITYSGGFSLTPHPQEIPALFPAQGIDHTYYFYSGGAPYADVAGGVSTVVAPPNTQQFWLPGHGPATPSSDDWQLSEHWVSVCDAAQARCVTVATFRAPVERFAAAPYDPSAGGYLTPTGVFSIATGLDKRWTVYLFPYRYDASVAGRTVRDWIYSLASDTANCGATGVQCAPGESCIAGACVAPGAMDAGVPEMDSGVVDIDSGVPDMDSGVPEMDSGSGETDAGSTGVDAGHADSGAVVADAARDAADANAGRDAGRDAGSARDAANVRDAAADASADVARTDAGNAGAATGCQCGAAGGSRGTGRIPSLAMLAVLAVWAARRRVS